MIKKMLEAVEEFKPKTGFNVVGVDDFELPGEELYVVKHFKDNTEADKFAKTNDDYFVIGAEEVEEKAQTTAQPTTPKSFEQVFKEYLKDNKKEIIDLVNKLKSGKIKGIKANFIDDMLKKLGLVSFLEPKVKKFVEKNYDKGLQQAEKQFERNFFPNKEAVDFLQDYNFDLVKNLSEELKNKLKSTLQRGYLEDVSQAQIKKEVRNIFGNMEDRAKAIVRTEQARAENYGELEGAEQSELVKGKTITNYMDAKTSPLCRRMINKYGDKLIPLDQNFKDDNTGESWKSPPFHVNCRTSLLTRMKEDTNND